ncbi:MAG: RidA family protein [Planctomycetia bacterium]|nr:RidA family protein [Planctomycetia bacterium]
MKSKVIHPVDVQTAGPGYSPAILTAGGKLLFISGQGPRDMEADVERQTFEQIRELVDAAGGSMRHVVMIRAYFLNMARDLATYRKVRQEFLVEPFPAATAVGVTELAVPGLQVEIEAVAVLG